MAKKYERVNIGEIDDFSIVNCPVDIIYKDGRRETLSASENLDRLHMSLLLDSPDVEVIYFPKIIGTRIGNRILDDKGEWQPLKHSKANARRLRQIEKGMIKVNSDGNSTQQPSEQSNIREEA